MKMEPIVSSETSAIKSQTPGNYPKRNKLQSIYYQHDTWVTGKEVRKTESERVVLWDKTWAASGLTLDVENKSEVCGTQS